MGDSRERLQSERNNDNLSVCEQIGGIKNFKFQHDKLRGTAQEFFMIVCVWKDSFVHAYVP